MAYIVPTFGVEMGCGNVAKLQGKFNAFGSVVNTHALSFSFTKLN